MRVWCALSLTGVPVFAQDQAPRAQGTKPAPANDLDAFMEKVLARREVNRKTLDQYVLDESEAFEILGPGRWPLHRTRARLHLVCPRRHARPQPGALQRRQGR